MKQLVILFALVMPAILGGQVIWETFDMMTKTRSIAQDCDGVLYLNSIGGILQYYDGSDFQNYNVEYRWDNCKINELVVNPHNCDLWGYSPLCRSLWRINEDEVRTIDIASRSIDHMAFDSDGNTYILHDGGNTNVEMIDTVGRTSLLTFQIGSSWRSYYRGIYVTQDDELWLYCSVLDVDSSNRINTTYEWVKCDKDNPELQFNFDYTFPYNNTSKCFEDGQKNLWFKSGVKSFIKYDGVNWEVITLEVPNWNDLIVDSENRFWFATVSGVVLYDEGDYTYYNTQDYCMETGSCLEIELVGNDLWIRHLNGLSRLDLSSLSENDNLTQADRQPILFPNPTSGQFTVQLHSAMDMTYEVYTMNGEHVMSGISKGQNEWSATLENGLYIVKIETCQGEFIEKLFVF